MAQKKSRYDKRLRELGFDPMSAEDTAYLERRINRRTLQMGVDISTLNRKERRALQKARCQPTFTVFTGEEPRTFANDELGRHWIAQKAVDATSLSALGFRNHTELLPLVAAFPPLPPEKTH